MLAKLAQYNTFDDRSDACARYLEAQFTILKDKTSELISSMRKTSKKDFLNNFREISEHPFIKSEYPSLSVAVADALFDAIHIDIFVKIAEKFAEDPYLYRNGWPDLTIVKGTEVQFIEVKTRDKLHESQLTTIPSMCALIPFPFSVVRVSKKAYNKNLQRT